MEEIKLKPCPFCGGEPMYTMVNHGEGGMVYCTKCGICTTSVLTNVPYTTYKAATAAWNRRVNEKDGGYMIHSVKCHPDYFKSLKDGTKTFEVRKKDHLYEVGDHLAINEFVPNSQVDPYSMNDGLRQTDGGFYTGDSLLYKITYILDDTEYCKDGMVILGLARCEI